MTELNQKVAFYAWAKSKGCFLCLSLIKRLLFMPELNQKVAFYD